MKALFFDCGTRDPLASWGLLLLRAGSGLMMVIGHGWPKAASFALIKDNWFVPVLLESFVSPPVSLLLTIAAELLAALLLVLGLATRPAAVVLGFTMAMAAFGALGSASLFISPGVDAKEPALLYLLATLVLLLSGGGAHSLDALISKPKRRSRYA